MSKKISWSLRRTAKRRGPEGVNCRLQVVGAGCRLQVAGCRCRLQVAGCDYIFFKQKMYDLYMVRFYLNFFKKIRIVSFVKKPW